MATWCSPELREQILTRDNYTCRNCGCDSLRILEIDHIVPTSKGGAVKDPENLQVLCGPCNRIKADHTIRFDIRPLRTERIDHDTIEFLMETRRLELELWVSMAREQVKEEKAEQVFSTRDEIVDRILNKKQGNRVIVDFIKRKLNLTHMKALDMLNEVKAEL